VEVAREGIVLLKDEGVDKGMISGGGGSSLTVSRSTYHLEGTVSSPTSAT